MKNNYLFSYIIAYRHTPERLDNLRKVIQWLYAFNGVEIIIVEEDNNSKLNNINIPAKHIFLKSKLPFNKSFAFNVGLNYTTTPIIVFGDSDVIVEPNSFVNSLNLIEKYDVINPYEKIIDLTQKETLELPIPNIFAINRDGRGDTDNQKVPFCGGITIFRIEAIEKIGGWNEDFIGWGCEDDFESFMVKKYLNYHQVYSRAYHLYHEKAPVEQFFYKRNLDLLNKLVKMNDNQLHNLIYNQRSKNGIKNKYEFF